jgi:NifU-like protein involved in Fe-S cluster formation
MQYSTLVEEHFWRTRNVGRLPSGPNVIASRAGSISDGVKVELSAMIEGGRIRELRQQVYGCPHTIAAASWLSEHLINSDQRGVQQWRWRQAADALQIPATKYGRLLVLEDAVHRLGKAWQQHLEYAV